MNYYNIDQWSDENFLIEDGLLKINYANKPSLLEIIKKVRKNGLRGPLLLRFPHLILKQIKSIYYHFNRSIKENNYNANFFAVFPLKVNQFPIFIKHILEYGKEFNYGLEAGSKAELVLAISLSSKSSPITVNGFKDKEMINLCFIASAMGHNISIIIEGLDELRLIIDIAKNTKTKLPFIGIRVRLHSSGDGVWAKSGGINSKFGLSSTELIGSLKLLRKNGLIKQFRMIHFHIGSQMSDIAPIKKALREVGNIYADLRKMGASFLDSINLGGGLAVEYGQNNSCLDRNYTIEEFSNDVVFLLKEISEKKGVKSPHIYTESGRFIAANHAVLVAPVLELFSSDYHYDNLDLKENNPPLVDELFDLYNSINEKNAMEYLHDALDHRESLFTLFDLSYIDLIDRSNMEILVHLIIKKVLILTKNRNTPELKKLQNHLQERYLVNISLFQSMPDFWAIEQKFPILPLSYLNQKPTRSASIWDITCDSDGEIGFNNKNPLYLHDINLDKEDYFLAFFLQGAYQETLGMKHNLFDKPSEVSIIFNEESYQITDLKESNTLMDIIESIGYDSRIIKNNLDKKIKKYNLSKELSNALNDYLNQNTYLRTEV